MKGNNPPPGAKQKAPETGHQSPQDEPRSLREASGETEIVLLPVSPDRVFAFWEMGEESAGGGDRNGDSHTDQAVLRFHESRPSPAANAQQDLSQEVPIEPQAGSRYFNLGQAGTTCQAEIGFADREGRFRQEARSTATETPRPLPPPEDTISRELTDGTGPLPPPSAPTRIGEPHPVSPPDLIPGPLPVERDESAVAKPEEFLVKRRLAIFRHLSEAVPLAEADHLLPTEQTVHLVVQGDMTRKSDLTEISERKFATGISSR